MRKLMLSVVLGAASLAAGAAYAQIGDASSEAGSAWRTNPNPNPNPNYGPIPGTPEYYGNSGGSLPTEQPHLYGYDNRGRAYGPYAYRSAPAHRHLQPSRRDRDGDGVRNSRDRYPDNPRRW
jgi:hypothetical protein